MNVKQITIVRTGDDFSKACFGYKGHSLETDPFPNTIDKEEIPALIKNRVNKWEEKWAEDNFLEIQTEYEGKDLEL
jgi:hypothetical protein